MRSKPNERFVWNWYLLKPVIKILHPDWILYMIHGFVDQSNVNVYGRSFYVSLIARRSRKYAGTRFLKRGANFEVSTEGTTLLFSNSVVIVYGILKKISQYFNLTEWK